MNQEFKRIIEEIRFRTGLNQTEIAGRLGVSKSRLSDIASGRVAFSDNMRSKIREEFGGEFGGCEQSSGGVPLLPVLAHAGSLADFSAAVGEHECERIVSPVRGAELAVPVHGDSMAPEFPGGSIVFVKRIDESAFIEWGKAHILDTVNGAVLKYLTPGEDGKVRCVSANPDPIYAPFEVSREDILGVYKVVMCMSMK